MTAAETGWERGRFKLTTPQLRVLRQVRVGDVAHGMDFRPYDDTLNWTDPAHRVNARVLDRLLDLGLVVRRQARPADGYRATVKEYVYRATRTGRCVLAGCEQAAS